MDIGITLPHFGEKTFTDKQITPTYRTINISDADPESFDSYCNLLAENGFEVSDKCINPKSCFAALEKNDGIIFINFFKATNELMIVCEDNSNYYKFLDVPQFNTVSPQITQIYLEDFGMSYAVRLCDGRFILFDGGREFEPDATRLFECLKKGSPFEKPIIAAWIMTHPHSDHFHCFIPFTDLYGDKVVIENMMFNFPDVTDTEHYPNIKRQDPRFENNSESIYIPMFLNRIKEMGIPVYTPHTGQSFEIGDATIKILASMDDTYHLSSNINMTSLVIMMELGGQKILWTADASFEYSKLCERYGEMLKADILQVPHHGFTCGSAKSEIRGYELVRPSVCMLPVNDFNAYTVINIYKEATLHLMTKVGIKEMITGEVTRTLTLPYFPKEHGVEELKQNIDNGFKRAGAQTWVFTDLSTAEAEDFIFTFLNMTSAAAEINAELFYEAPEARVRFIKIAVSPARLRTLSIIDPDSVESEALYFNWMSLKKVGIPENMPFAVRFISNVPVVISHKKHKETYFA